MPPDPDIQDQMLELIYGLLADNEAERLRAKIGSDAELARLYEQVRETAAILGDAARLQSPRLVLARPPAVAPAGGEPPPAWRIVEAAGPPPWSRGAYWAVTAAASILILPLRLWLEPASCTNGRLEWRTAAAARDGAIVDPREGRSTLHDFHPLGHGAADSRQSQFCRGFTCRFAPLGPHEQTDEAGKLEVTIPADLDLPRRSGWKSSRIPGKPASRPKAACLS